MRIPLVASRGKGKGHGRPPKDPDTGDPGGGEGPPPTRIINGFWYRFKGTNGVGRSSLAVPLIKGELFAAGVAQTVAYVGSSEVASYMEGLGRFNDGSFRTLLVQADVNVSVGTPVAGSVRLGQAPTLSRLSKTTQTYTRVLTDPRQAGYPNVGFWPSDVNYLVQTQLAGPMISQAAGMALGGRFLTYEQRFVDHALWWWNPNAGVGPFGTAASFANPQAFGACHIGNTNYNGFDLSNPSEDFVTWRNAVGSIGPAGHNYYDAGLIHVAWGARTANPEYVIMGLAYSWHYMSQWAAINNVPPYNMNGFAAQPEGCGLHYLLTGALIGKEAVEGMCDRFFFQLFSAYFAGSPDGIGYGCAPTDVLNCRKGLDPRESGRILLCALVALRLGCTHTQNSPSPVDFGGIADDMITRLTLAPGDNVMRRADGTWRNERCDDAPGMYLNTFMGTIQMDAMIKYYEERQVDARIPSAIKQCIDTYYNTLFGIWEGTFDGINFYTVSVKSFRNVFEAHCAALVNGSHQMGEAVDLTLMYPHIWSWYASVSGDSSYHTKADEIFSEGVGTGIGGGNGPAIHGTFTSAQKIMKEAHCFSWRHLAYRV